MQIRAKYQHDDLGIGFENLVPIVSDDLVVRAGNKGDIQLKRDSSPYRNGGVFY